MTAVHSGLVGQKLKVTLELPTGEVLSGMAVAAQIEQYPGPIDVTGWGDTSPPFIPGFQEWTLTLEGTGVPLWTGTRMEAVKRQHKEMSAIEWTCDYCGCIWPKTTAKCVQCGGHRSFVYDV